jgi:hypothetical protein
VVGFSRVKDERRASQLADASRRRPLSATPGDLSKPGSYTSAAAATWTVERPSWSPPPSQLTPGAQGSARVPESYRYACHVPCTKVAIGPSSPWRLPAMRNGFPSSTRLEVVAAVACLNVNHRDGFDAGLAGGAELISAPLARRFTPSATVALDRATQFESTHAQDERVRLDRAHHARHRGRP